MQIDDFITSYVNAWNSQDAAAVAAHLETEGVYHNIPEGLLLNRSELEASLANYFEEDAIRFELVGNLTTGGETVAFQYRFTYVDEPDSPMGFGAEFITLGADAALSIADYFEDPWLSPATQRAHLASKYAKSGLADEQLESYKRELERVMLEDRLFTQSDLSLPVLAERLGCSVNHLSQVINAGFEMNFFDYLNRHRVDHARALLADRTRAGSSILNIAFAAGFNSSSAFYSAFRKHVGISPARFRREQANRNAT